MCISRRAQEDLADTAATPQRGTGALPASGTAGRGTAAPGTPSPGHAGARSTRSRQSWPCRVVRVGSWRLRDPSRGGCPAGSRRCSRPVQQQRRCRQPCSETPPSPRFQLRLLPGALCRCFTEKLLHSHSPNHIVLVWPGPNSSSVKYFFLVSKAQFLLLCSSHPL